MSAVRIKEAVLRITDPVFYPDIAEARKVSENLLSATSHNEVGVTVRIDERWRNMTVRRDLRFSLVSSTQWFENMANQIRENVVRRDREAIQRSMHYLAKQGSVLN